MSREQGTHDYLTELLNRYWFAPPVALWRAVELRTVAQEPFEPPLLDLGCGDGMVGEVLFGAGAVCAGVDPWLAQLRRAARSGVYRTLALGDGARLPYADGAFATVFSNSVLEHIPLLEPVLGEVARVLRPLGRFVFTVPSDAFPRLLAARRDSARDTASWKKAGPRHNSVEVCDAKRKWNWPDGNGARPGSRHGNGTGPGPWTHGRIRDGAGRQLRLPELRENRAAPAGRALQPGQMPELRRRHDAPTVRMGKGMMEQRNPGQRTGNTRLSRWLSTPIFQYSTIPSRLTSRRWEGSNVSTGHAGDV